MKKSITLLFAVLFYGIYCIAQSDLNKGLLVYYPFSGNANNTVSDNFNGNVKGAILNFDRFGNNNNAYFFDGVDDCIDIVDFGDSVPSKEISVSIWIRSLEIQWSFQLMLCPDNNRFAFAANFGGRDYWDFGWRGDGGDAHGRLYYSSADDNAWHHYVLISNTENGSMRIYKDNILKAYKSYPLQLLNAKSKDLRIGGGDGESFFKGLLDDIRIYNRQITEDEIKLLFEEKICDVAITKQPKNISEFGGSSSSFSTEATGESLNYKWQINSGSGFENIENDCFYSGELTPTLSISTLSNQMHNNQFRCLISNTVCIDTTDFASITIDSSRIIVYDTIYNSVFDTIFTTVFDTVHFMKYDTTFISVTDTLIIEISTGVDFSDISCIKIFPNPANKFINIDFGNFEMMKGYYIKMINSVGQIEIVSQISQERMQIDLSSLSGKGIYHIQIIDNKDNVVAVRKIVLQ